MKNRGPLSEDRQKKYDSIMARAVGRGEHPRKACVAEGVGYSTFYGWGQAIKQNGRSSTGTEIIVHDSQPAKVKKYSTRADTTVQVYAFKTTIENLFRALM